MTCNDKCIHYPVCEQKNFEFANIEECPYYQDNNSCWWDGYNTAKKLFEKTGEWVDCKNGNIKCNKCGCEIRYSYLIGNKPDFPKFCCDCGASMRGKEVNKNETDN